MRMVRVAELRVRHARQREIGRIAAVAGDLVLAIGADDPRTDHCRHVCSFSIGQIAATSPNARIPGRGPFPEGTRRPYAPSRSTRRSARGASRAPRRGGRRRRAARPAARRRDRGWRLAPGDSTGAPAYLTRSYIIARHSAWTGDRSPLPSPDDDAPHRPAQRPHRDRHGDDLRRAQRLPAPGRLRRRRDQGRAPGRRRRRPAPGRVRRRRQLLLADRRPQQAADRARPQVRRGPRGAAAPGRARRRAGRELPPRRAWSGWASIPRPSCSRPTQAWWCCGSPATGRPARTPAAPASARWPRRCPRWPTPPASRTGRPRCRRSRWPTR